MTRHKIAKLDPESVIPPYAFEFYRVAIDDAARSAISAFLAYGEELNGSRNEAEVARHLQDALSHCAAISRFFWPQWKAGPVGTYRGAELRRMYHVRDDSPLHNRGLRNALEHFDEEIDKWLMKVPVGPIVASPVIGDHSIIDDGFGHAFKVVDPDNDIFVILGEKFEFGSICREVARLLTDEKNEDQEK
jgi:hypothetical protein